MFVSGNVACSSRLYACGQEPALFGRVGWAWLWYVVDGQLALCGRRAIPGHLPKRAGLTRSLPHIFMQHTQCQSRLRATLKISATPLFATSNCFQTVAVEFGVEIIQSNWNNQLCSNHCICTMKNALQSGPHIMPLNWNLPSIDKNTNPKLFINANKLYHIDWLSWVRNPDVASIRRLVKSNLFINPPSVFSGQLRTR